MGCSSSIPDTSRSDDKKRTSAVKTENSKTVLKQSTKTTIVEVQTVRTETNTDGAVQGNTEFRRKEYNAVAFTIDMNGNELQNTIGWSETGRRLGCLEPLNVPPLTSELLAEKQKQLYNNIDKVAEKMEKAKLYRDRKRQALREQQMKQTAHANRVRAKAKKCKEVVRHDADMQLWSYSADEGDSSLNDDSQTFMADTMQQETPQTCSTQPSDNCDPFFDS